MEAVLGLCGDEVVDEVGGDDEADAIPAEAGDLPEGRWRGGSCRHRGRRRRSWSSAATKSRRGGLRDEVTIDELRVVEVVGVEGGEREDGGALEGGAWRDASIQTRSSSRMSG